MNSTPTLKTSGKSAAAGDIEQAVIDQRNTQVLTTLRTYQQSHGISDSMRDLAQLANRVGTSGTYLYRYLTNDFKGNLESFEAKLTAFFTGDQVEQVTTNSEIIGSDFIIAATRAFLRHVREHGFIGVGHGPAGRGKTCASKLYAAQNAATTIYLHIPIWRSGRHDLTRAIARAMGITRPPKGVLIDDHLVWKLKDSGRLLIIDNAHRLTESARRWLADFWEETRLPIALIGNPEIEQQWQRNDQHGSRVGLHRDITLDLAKKPATAKATAHHLLQLHLPAGQDNAQILTDAASLLAQFGSCRAVVMRANLASRILSGDRVTDPAEAWHLAKTQLINAA
jgi:DNA transposition AAA+ family ATPase